MNTIALILVFDLVSISCRMSFSAEQIIEENGDGHRRLEQINQNAFNIRR